MRAAADASLPQIVGGLVEITSDYATPSPLSVRLQAQVRLDATTPWVSLDAVPEHNAIASFTGAFYYRDAPL